MHLSDRITGGVIALLGALAIWGATRLPGVPGQDVGPAAFPTVIGVGMVLCGAMIAFGIGHSFEVPEDEEEMVVEDGAMPMPQHPILRALIPPALLLFYLLTVDHLGFLIAAAIVVYLAVVALHGRWVIALPLAIIGPLAVHLIFYKLLRVPLPDGLLPAPWS